MSRHLKKPRFAVLAWPRLMIVVLLAGLLLLGLELTNTTHFLHTSKAVSGAIPSTNPSSHQNIPSTNSATRADTSNSSSSPSSQKSGAVASGTSGSLEAPFGAFVSNHRPGANGSPLSEESVCNTNPGATCYIKFVHGDVVKTLPSQTVDASGATYWNWNVSQAGLTSGAWQISAVASLNGQTKTSTDPLNLDIQ